MLASAGVDMWKITLKATPLHNNYSLEEMRSAPFHTCATNAYGVRTAVIRGMKDPESCELQKTKKNY